MNYENSAGRVPRRDFMFGRWRRRSYIAAAALGLAAIGSFGESMQDEALARGYEQQLIDPSDNILTEGDRKYLSAKAGNLRKDANKWINRFLILGKTATFLAIIGQTQKDPAEKIFSEINEL